MLPETITLIEVGPRDGFQLESCIIPTDLKAEIILALADAGLRYIQIASFVNPVRVPQMADAEALISLLSKTGKAIFTGLALNLRGVERAYRAGLTHIEVSVSASHTHSQKNTGMTLNQAIEEGMKMIRLSKNCNLNVVVSIQCAFGCVYEGIVPEERVLEMAQRFADLGVERLSIADTTGMATPLQVRRLLKKLSARIPVPISLHFHDTRGLGLVNVMAAIEGGIRWFDTSLGGMGGCPFVPGAAGNIATEDTAYLMESLNIHTGVDIAKVAACTRRLEQFLGKQFPGKMHRLA